ncbi:MAG: 3-phosphate cyclase [Pseudomonadota bacterium]
MNEKLKNQTAETIRSSMIALDGASGEGGGQILRSALALSIITGKPFCIENIRGNRPKPGLMRQHLVAVQAASKICNAKTSELKLGASSLLFEPGQVVGGEYEFDIGSAGSCTLVLQTILPALLFADTASQISIKGGTHNPMAPPLHFLQRAWLPQLAKMGVQMELGLERFGFFPAGGGKVVAQIQPCRQLLALHLDGPGARVDAFAESYVAGVPGTVALRELDFIRRGMNWADDKLHPRTLPDSQGPGNVLILTLQQEQVTEVFCALGEKSLSSEAVANQAMQQLRRYLKSGAAVGEYLADQLMLPMALAGAGSFTVGHVSPHARTNAEVIAQFLPVAIRFEAFDKLHRCVIQSLKPTP